MTAKNTGQKCLILWHEKEVVGTLQETRGNDADYPTFTLENGESVGIHVSQIIRFLPEDNVVLGEN